MIARMLACLLIGAVLGAGGGYVVGERLGLARGTDNMERACVRRGLMEYYADRDGYAKSRFVKAKRQK